MAELKLDLTWTTAKLTVISDVKKTLVEVATPGTIRSSWQKATLTRCTSDELFVRSNEMVALRSLIMHGTPLPTAMDEIMDGEEELVLIIDRAANEDRGWWQGIACALQVGQSCHGLSTRAPICSPPAPVTLLPPHSGICCRMCCLAKIPLG